MTRRLISCIGLCDFRRKGTRRPEHRRIVVDHLYLWLWHNHWDIPKKRLMQFDFRQLIGMLHALADGRGSFLIERLLREYGYWESTAGLAADNTKGVRSIQLSLM